MRSATPRVAFFLALLPSLHLPLAAVHSRTATRPETGMHPGWVTSQSQGISTIGSLLVLIWSLQVYLLLHVRGKHVTLPSCYVLECKVFMSSFSAKTKG